MAVSLRAVPALAVVLFASVFVVADDAQKADLNNAGNAGADAQAAAADAKSEAKAGTKAARQAQARQVRLTKPWRDLASLSDDQKKQINQIHRKAVQQIKAIEQGEKDEIMALLDDKQKAELAALLEKDAAERKAKAAQRAKPAADASPKAGGSDAATAVAEKAEAQSKSAVGSN